MNLFANIWQHPRTSLAGLLIAVGTIAGVLGQQGVTLGNLGAGTVVSFVAALSAALLGLMARDPEAKPERESTNQKLGVWALIALLLSGTLPMAGCSGESVAQQIVDWTPSLSSAVVAVNSLVASLDPADSTAFETANVALQAASNLLVTQARAYLVDPTATTLRQLQNQIVALQQQVNATLLATARISNSTSQQHVLTEVQAVATIAMAILSLVQSVSSKSDVRRMAAESAVKLACIRPLMDAEGSARLVANAYHVPLRMARMQILQTEANLVEAGF